MQKYNMFSATILFILNKTGDTKSKCSPVISETGSLYSKSFIHYAKLSVIMSISLILISCSSSVRFTNSGKSYTPSNTGDKSKSIEPAKIGEVETGMASFYGDAFHGRTTASGSVYDQYQLTAAHRTLPFGTKVLVANKKNGKTVVVEITDRGPFKGERIIDLSTAAAQKIEMIKDGVVPVEIKVIGN